MSGDLNDNMSGELNDGLNDYLNDCLNGNTVMLRVTGVHKAFGNQPVLHGVDLVVPAGSITTVLGPSGCGKTTLLRLIAGFEEPDEGTIEIAGQTMVGNGRSTPPERRRVGVVPQEGALFPHLDLAGNIGYGLDRAARKSGRVEEMLALVGLAGMGHRRAHELSGGQQQRAALARALAPGPALVLLDEPFSSLDAAMRAQVRDEVFDVLRLAGATAVLVTHDQQEALSVSDQVAVLLGGRVAQCGEPNQVYARPASLDVATFVGEVVVLPALATDGVAQCALGPVELTTGSPTNGTVDVVIRPEQFVVSSVGSTGAPDQTQVEGVVVGRSYFGHDGTVRIALPGGETLTCRLPAGRLPARGTRLTVHVATPVVAFPATR